MGDRLFIRNGPAGIVLHDGSHHGGDPGAGVAAPEEVKARRLNEELVFAGRDGKGKGELHGGVENLAVARGGAEPGSTVNAEHEDDEEK